MANLTPRNSPWLLPVCIFLFLASMTLLVWQHQMALQSTARAEEINRASAGYTTDITDHLRMHAQFLRAVQAFASAHRENDHEAWQIFATEAEANTHLAGISSFAYAPAIPAASKLDFTKHIRAKLHDEAFNIYPVSSQSISFPVTLISPESPEHNSALGFDVYSEAVRRQAIDTAVATRDVTLSGNISLVYDQSIRPGFLLVKALFHRDMPLNTVHERRLALSGVVVAGFRMHEFMAAISRSLEQRFILQIFDDGSSARPASEQPPHLIYSSDPQWTPSSGEPPLHHEIQFGNRHWIVHFYPRSNFFSSAITTPTLILISGLLLSLLLAFLIFHQITHRTRAERYAHKLTAELRKSEERFRLAATGTNDGLWDQNFETGEEFLSSRLGEIYGFSVNDMPHCVSDYLRRILPEDDPRRRASLSQHFKQNLPYDVEVRIRKQDGTQAWIRIRGEAVRDAQGKAVRLAGSLSDVTQLHLAEQALREHRDHLQKIVDERTARLEKALHQAILANQAKSEFLANMSHELRTPMHAIISFARLGQNRTEITVDDKLRQYFDRINESANRLLVLINDLLDLSKLESGQQQLEFTAVDMLTLTKNIQAQLESLLQSRQLTLRLEECATADHRINADCKRMEQVIHNLLSNAIKFSPAGAQIIIRFYATHLPRGRRAGDTGQVPALALQIIDAGPGIPESELEAIFDKFYQSTRTKTGAGGTGLGLAICREAIHQHQGSIVASNNPTGGATVTVIVPRNLETPTS